MNQTFRYWVCPVMGCPKWSREIWYENCPVHGQRFVVMVVSTPERLQEIIAIHEQHEPAMDDPSRSA